MATYNILAISGSLRKDSYNTALLRAFRDQAPEGVEVDMADIGVLGLYTQEADGSFPESVIELKKKIREADGILISTPEYNRSVPGVLKNAIDWTSRPYGDNAWAGKPVYVIGASTGPIAAALAQYEVKRSMLYLDAHVMGQPEFYCGVAQAKFEDGVLTEGETKKHVDSSLMAFLEYIEKLR